MARNKQAERTPEFPSFQERVVYINRVSKVVKGGRRFALTALVVVGDGNGRVGVGMGKSQEVPIAIKKGVEDAKKNMFTVPLTAEKTLPHEIMGEYGAGRVLIKPATPGTGVIAGGPVRAIMELAGVDRRAHEVAWHQQRHEHRQGRRRGPEEHAEPPGSGCPPQHVGRPRSSAGRRANNGRQRRRSLRLTQVKSSDRPPGRSGQDAARARAWARSAARSSQVDNESVRGMIFKVKHLITVEEVEGYRRLSSRR